MEWLLIPYLLIGLLVGRWVYRLTKRTFEGMSYEPALFFIPTFSVLLWPVALAVLVVVYKND